MDNIALARLLDETAALLEIDGADTFRVRSYRRAAEAVEQQTTQVATLAGPEADPKELLAIPGIGKGMAANLRDLVATGTMPPAGGAAGPVSADDAGVAAAAGDGAEDGGARMERAAGIEHR